MRFFLFIFLISCFACSDARRDIRDYYYPIRTMTDGKVYVYQDPDQPNRAPNYWYYLGIDQDSALYLSSTAYLPDFEPGQQVTEQIFNEGVVLKQLAIAFPDSVGQLSMVNAEVEAGNAFPFYLEADERPAYVVKLSFEDELTQGNRQNITFNRQYQRDTTVEVMGESYDALVFKLVAEFYIEEAGLGGIQPGLSGYEIYAEGLGLVETQRKTESGTVILNDRLVEVISMEEMISRAEGQ
ncbi:MAG: hypothetical protein AAF433_08085 [Bacteroidota bacterium]